MKICYRCKIEKSSKEFSKDKTNSDGLQGWCKECSSQYKLKHRNRTWDKAHPAKCREYKAKYEKRNPLKYNAHRALNKAIKKGILIRLPCEQCGESKAEGHHPDYHKPLEVIWLCHKCHVELHRNKTPLV